ncbi:hypothetical protein [Enterococcus sp. DIV0240a]|uniref:hypothetical protein n=1 Tax=unclassified Enterococcus TaxID=2608891 RepID=UPI003D2989A9
MSKKEQIKKQQAEFLETMKAIREEMDIDAIAELFLSVISIYGLKMDETASLLYFIQKQTIEAEHNSKFLKERLGLDVTELGIDGVLQVQRALVNTYASQVRKAGNKHG